jgi:hypothetical protein
MEVPMFGRSLLALGVLALVCMSQVAKADEAVVVVDGPYAEPPPARTQPIVPVESYEPRYYREEPPPYDHKRAPVRLSLGPAFLTTGKGVGVGLGLGVELGSGVVGGRLGATWLRGEGTQNGVIAPTGDSVGHYVGELTLDILKRGSVHPVVAVGGGILHVSRPDTSGVVAVGTVRGSLEYFAPIDDADLRIGLDVTGGLAGPGAESLRDVKGYGLFGVHAALGF